MDAMRFLDTEDAFEAATMAAVASRRLELRDTLADQDAIRTANAVVNAFNG